MPENHVSWDAGAPKFGKTSATLWETNVTMENLAGKGKHICRYKCPTMWHCDKNKLYDWFVSVFVSFALTMYACTPCYTAI